ncbi:MAG: EF-hand domain-containing protein [Bacteroidota bacterium]
MRHVILPAVVAALVLPATAGAQLAPSQGGCAALAAFNRLDRDGDHAVTLAELRRLGRDRGADRLFVLLDADGDGRISVKELGAANGALLARFDAYDANKDGFVSRHEFPNFVDPLLVAALDRNHDGRLSLAELRPTFAGARAATPLAPMTRQARAQTKPQPQSWCWVTGFGSHDWTIEAPVVWGNCRTR